MKALIVDGEELFCLSLKEVVAAAGPFDEVRIANCEREFMAEAAKSHVMDLIIFHPGTLTCEGSACLTLAKRLYPRATLVTLLDPGVQDRKPEYSQSPWASTHTILRSASVRSIIASIRAAMNLPADSPRARVGSMRPKVTADHMTTDHGAAPHSPVKSASDAVRELSRLSVRQREILTMAADGLPNKEIAARLSIAEGTVKAHMHAVFKVMGVSNRTQAVLRFSAATPPSETNVVHAAF